MDSHIGTPPLTSLLLRNLYPLRPLIIPSSPESESPPLFLPATRATPNTSAQLLVADGRPAGGEPGPPVGGPRVASPLSESFWAHVERPPSSPWLGGGWASSCTGPATCGCYGRLTSGQPCRL